MKSFSKLALARIARDLTQAQVAEAIQVDPVTVSRWEGGHTQPYPRHVNKLCDLFGKSAAELGLAEEVEETEETEETEEDALVLQQGPPPETEPVFAPIFQRNFCLRGLCLVYDWQRRQNMADFPTVLQQYRQTTEDDKTMTKEPKENHTGVDMGRREALQALALLPIHVLGLGAIDKTPRWTSQELLTSCAEGVIACKHLSQGQGSDLSLASHVLSTYLPPLKQIVEASSPHRQEAARLIAHSLLIKATVSLHREGPKQAISFGQQAVIYGKESGDISLQVVILKRLAWMYACGNQEKQALETVLQAQFLLEGQQEKDIPIHPITQSSIYGGVAKYQARNGQSEEALAAIHEAYDAFFAGEQSDKDVTSEKYDHFNYSHLLLEEGLTNYHLEQYEQALEVFAQAIDPETLMPKAPVASERSRVEIINHETLTSLKRPTKDLELSLHLWMAGIQGAKALQSEQRLSEALEAYSIMQALWPSDKRIKELRDLTRHW